MGSRRSNVFWLKWQMHCFLSLSDRGGGVCSKMVAVAYRHGDPATPTEAYTSAGASAIDPASSKTISTVPAVNNQIIKRSIALRAKFLRTTLNMSPRRLGRRPANMFWFLWASNLFCLTLWFKLVLFVMIFYTNNYYYHWNTCYPMAYGQTRHRALLYACMFICVYVYMFICLYVYICICLYVYV